VINGVGGGTRDVTQDDSDLAGKKALREKALRMLKNAEDNE
jgi:hypothetical protein